MPDVVPARQHVDPRARRARRARAARRRIASRRRCRATTSSPASSTRTSIDGDDLGACPGTSTRACSSIAATSLARRACAPPPRRGTSGATRWSACARRSGPDRYAILLPLTEWETPVILALQRGADAAARRRPLRRLSRAPAFRDAFAFYLDLFARGLAPRAGAAQIANLYQDFAAGYFAFYVSGPVEPRRVRARACRATLADDWATAPLPAPDAGRPGVSLAGGASLAIVARVAATRTPRGAGRVPRRARAAGRVLRAHRRPAGAPLGVERPARSRGDARARRSATQLEHVRATPKVPEWERIAATIARHAEAAVRGERDARRGARRARRATSTRILEKRRWMLARARAGGR